MSFTEDVADFLDTLGPFYEIVYDNGSPTKIEKLEEILKKNKMDVDTGYILIYIFEVQRKNSKKLCVYK